MSDAGEAMSGLRENAAFLRRLARALCNDEHLAEDAFQETQRAALEHPPRRAGGMIRPWLAALMRNAIRRELRSRARREAREAEAARVEALPSAAGLAEREELLRLVLERVLGLPELYREVVILRFYEDLPPRRIATRLGLSVETVRTRLKRALARLRTELGGARGMPALAFLAWSSPPREAVSIPPAVVAMATSTRIVVSSAVVLLLGTVAWRLAQPNRDLHRTSAEPSLAPSVSAVSAKAAPRPASSERTPAVFPGPEWIIAGRVIDEAGAGVAAAKVHIVAERDPFGSASTLPTIRVNSQYGRTLSTDESGAFRGQLASGERVLVVLAKDPAWVPVEPSSRWVEPPQLDVELALVRRSTASLEVRVVRASDGMEQPEFVVAGSWPDGPYEQQHAREGRVEFEFPVEGGKAIEPRVRLLEPKLKPPIERRIRLTAGERRELVLVLPVADLVSGFVVDQDGKPIEGALVVLGDETTGRGDELFRPMRPEAVVGGVRTRADGWYRLEGAGARVTAWHPDHSSATVERENAERITLLPHASLEVHLVDQNGAPRAAVAVRLDDRERGLEVTTDTGGRLQFERLEAGVHALWENRTLLAAVRLEAGQGAVIELSEPPLEGVELELRIAGAPAELEALNGIVVGEGDVFGVHELAWQAGRDPADLGPRIDGPLRPGVYLLLTREGFAKEFELDGLRAVLDLDPGRLLVHAAPGSRLQVVPNGADCFLRLLAARVPAVVPESGELAFHVAPGSWLVVGERGGQRAQVEVRLEGTRIALDE